MLSNQAEEQLLQRVGAAQARQNGGSHGSISRGYTGNNLGDTLDNMHQRPDLYYTEVPAHMENDNPMSKG